MPYSDCRNIEMGDIFEHHSGRRYMVLCVANTIPASQKFPITVVYQSVKDYSIWTRHIEVFRQKFKRIKEPNDE